MADQWEAITHGRPWKPFTVEDRTFVMDDIRDPAVLWDVTENPRTIVAEFRDFGHFTPIELIVEAIETHLKKLRG